MTIHRKPRRQISLLVPFDSSSSARGRHWQWLRQYWRAELPHAEIVVGRDRSSKRRPWRRHPRPFSKTSAILNAARRAHGDIYAIVDADAYVGGHVLTDCAKRIRSAEDRGIKLWFVPYHAIARLTKAATARLVASNPRHPLRFPTPPDPHDVTDIIDNPSQSSGREFGAMLTVMSREAFWSIGGPDPRFVGWGGEDVAFKQAVDTLWAPAKFMDEDLFHLWHPTIDWQGATSGKPVLKGHRTRMWSGQPYPSVNTWLAETYAHFAGRPEPMRHLVDESHRRRQWWRL